MEQPRCPPRAGSGDPEGKRDWGGRANGLYVALKWLAWFGCGEGAASKPCPGWWWRQDGPVRASSQVHIRCSLGGKLPPHPSCPQTASPRPPGRTGAGPVLGSEAGRSSEGRRGIRPFRPIGSTTSAVDRARVPCPGLQVSRSVSVFRCFWVPPPQLWFLFASL